MNQQQPYEKVFDSVVGTELNKESGMIHCYVLVLRESGVIDTQDDGILKDPNNVPFTTPLEFDHV